MDLFRRRPPVWALVLLPVLLVQRARHLGALGEVRRPVAVTQHEQLGPHLLGERPGRRRVRLSAQLVYVAGEMPRGMTRSRTRDEA